MNTLRIYNALRFIGVRSTTAWRLAHLITR